MLQNPNFFGAVPRTPLKYLTAPDPLADGEGFAAPLPRTPPRLLALRASFLRVSRSNPLQTWQPY